MNDMLSSFLEEKEREQKAAEERAREAQRAQIEKEKIALLLSQGLYEKVYSDTGEYSDEYSNAEWDPVTQEYKYFKAVPIEITDEEFEQLKKYSEPATTVSAPGGTDFAAMGQPQKAKSNPVATALTIIACAIYLFGFIMGIKVGSDLDSTYFYEYTYTAAFICWAIALINGTLMLGFAEVIKLLDSIKKNQK